MWNANQFALTLEGCFWCIYVADIILTDDAKYFFCFIFWLNFIKLYFNWWIKAELKDVKLKALKKRRSLLQKESSNIL